MCSNQFKYPSVNRCVLKTPLPEHTLSVCLNQFKCPSANRCVLKMPLFEHTLSVFSNQFKCPSVNRCVLKTPLLEHTLSVCLNQFNCTSANRRVLKTPLFEHTLSVCLNQFNCTSANRRVLKTPLSGLKTCKLWSWLLMAWPFNCALFQESRVLKFWFAPNTDYLDKVTGAYEFFRELVRPDNFPRSEPSMHMEFLFNLRFAIANYYTFLTQSDHNGFKTHQRNLSRNFPT